MRMDLLYTQPMQNFLDEAAELEIKVVDASDYIHTERVEIHYPEDKKEDYLALLKSHKLLEYSMHIQMK